MCDICTRAFISIFRCFFFLFPINTIRYNNAWSFVFVKVTFSHKPSDAILKEASGSFDLKRNHKNSVNFDWKCLVSKQYLIIHKVYEKLTRTVQIGSLGSLFIFVHNFTFGDLLHLVKKFKHYFVWFQFMNSAQFHDYVMKRKKNLRTTKLYFLLFFY